MKAMETGETGPRGRTSGAAASRRRDDGTPRQGDGRSPRLGVRQRRFVEEYLVDMSPVRAAERAGYAPERAARTAARLLRTPAVLKAVERAMDSRAARTGVTQDLVVRELAAVGFTVMTDLCQWSDEGVRLRDSTELTRAQAAAVAEVREGSTTRAARPARGMRRRSFRRNCAPASRSYIPATPTRRAAGKPRTPKMRRTTGTTKTARRTTTSTGMPAGTRRQAFPATRPQRHGGPSRFPTGRPATHPEPFMSLPTPSETHGEDFRNGQPGVTMRTFSPAPPARGSDHGKIMEGCRHRPYQRYSRPCVTGVPLGECRAQPQGAIHEGTHARLGDLYLLWAQLRCVPRAARTRTAYPQPRPFLPRLRLPCRPRPSGRGR